MNMMKYIFFVCLVPGILSGFPGERNITIEYEGTAAIFAQVHALEPSVKKLFPQIKKYVPVTWYTLLSLSPNASEGAIRKRSARLMRQIPSGCEDAKQIVKKAEQAGLGQLSYRVMAGKEIEEVTPAQLLTEQEYTHLKSAKKLGSSWKRWAFIQSIISAGAAVAYTQTYIDDATVFNLRRYSLLHPLLAKVAALPAIARWGMIGGAVLAMIGYHRYRFNALYKVSSFDYVDQKVENRIVVMYRRTYSHAEHRGNTIVHYYNYSDPLGYMTTHHWDAFSASLSQANKLLLASSLILGLSSAGLIWAGWPDQMVMSAPI